MFFEEQRAQFFKPLTSKYRSLAAECLRLLYMRLYSAMADYGYALRREQVLEVFQEAVTRAPEQAMSDTETEEEAELIPRNDRELAALILNTLLDNGWLEVQVDEATLQSSYRFSRYGRMFTQPFVELSGRQVRTRHRNTRNTRNALSAFLQLGEVHDLLDAYEYSERIISDFTDVITELEDRKRQLVRELDIDQLIQKASDEFFDFMEKRFQPDLSVRLSADSVEKHRDDIFSLVEQIKQQSKEFKAAAEGRLRELLPDMIVQGQSLLWSMLDSITLRMTHASDIMLPALRSSLRSFTKRADIIMRQMSYLASQRNNDLVGLCDRLRDMPEVDQEACLERMGEAMSSVKIGLFDPAQVRMNKSRKIRMVDSEIFDAPPTDESARKTLFIQHALDQAFVINDQAVRHYVINLLRGGDRIHTKHLPITKATDFLAATHAIELASTNQMSSDYQFVVVPTGDRVSNDYLTESDDFIIEVKTLSHV
jgi:hypothetical protein